MRQVMAIVAEFLAPNALRIGNGFTDTLSTSQADVELLDENRGKPNWFPLDEPFEIPEGYQVQIIREELIKDMDRLGWAQPFNFLGNIIVDENSFSDNSFLRPRLTRWYYYSAPNDKSVPAKNRYPASFTLPWVDAFLSDPNFDMDVFKMFLESYLYENMGTFHTHAKDVGRIPELLPDELLRLKAAAMSRGWRLEKHVVDFAPVF